MRGILLLSVVTLLLGVAQSRSVQLDLLNLVKNAALSGKGADDADLYNIGGREVSGKGLESRKAINGKVGFILFGNLEDLEKYRIDLNENSDDKDISDIMLNSAYQVKENTNDLEVNQQISEERENENNERTNVQVENDEEQDKTDDDFIFKFQDDYEEDEDSKDYENVDETEGKEKPVIDIFSEDEYNDYKDNAAEEEVSEEDESEEERFYDEDEKYYEDENNKFNILKNNGDDNPFDGIFMEDS